MPRKYGFLAFIFLAAFFVGCENQPIESAEVSEIGREKQSQKSDLALYETVGNMVIANRASGTISVISLKDDAVSGTYNLPEGENQAQPMYVVYNLRNNTVFVGDRGNNRVVAFNAEDYSVKATIPAGNGVFHMWADPRGRQLWVNNDIDKTITVINPTTFEEIATVPVPQDLVDMGGKPHDVILEPSGRFAYVSILGVQGDSDYVVKFDTRFFRELGRAAVGKDPHLSLTQRNKQLYVPCQNGNAVYIINRRTMAVESVLDVPGAHGAGMALNGSTFYTTNLPGGGTNGLWAIDVRTNSVIGSVDTPFAIPHNVALSPLGDKIYVTHSGGSSNKVTVFTVDKKSRIPVFSKEIEVGLNPFGLAFSL